MAPRNSARQGDGRIGVLQRKDTKKWVVEMRPPFFKKKLNFGSYKTKQEAMVARDYAAYLRSRAGEGPADAGGFGQDDHPIRLYEFKESPIIFEKMEELSRRLDEYQNNIVPLYQQSKGRLDKEAPKEKFCEAARKDIAVALELFQASHPDLLATSQPTEVTSSCEIPRIALASNPEVRVSLEPTPETGAITGHDDSIWKDVLETTVPVKILINIGGGFQLLLLETMVSLLPPELIFRIIEDHIDRGNILDALTKANLDKFLEDLPRCSVDPKSISEIDVSEDDLKT